MQLLSDTRPNTRSGGTAPARLCMLGVTGPALKVSCSVLNAAQLLSDTRPNTRSGGTAPARLCMLGVTGPALKVSCSVLNAAQLIRLT